LVTVDNDNGWLIWLGRSSARRYFQGMARVTAAAGHQQFGWPTQGPGSHGVRSEKRHATYMPDKRTVVILHTGQQLGMPHLSLLYLGKSNLYVSIQWDFGRRLLTCKGSILWNNLPELEINVLHNWIQGKL